LNPAPARTNLFVGEDGSGFAPVLRHIMAPKPASGKAIPSFHRQNGRVWKVGAGNVMKIQDVGVCA
jgi:hypothetical protein